jgi:hypothetical protein
MRATITIRIKANKRGKPIAHYWSRLPGRWLPLSVDAANLAIATGELFGCPAVEQQEAA